MKRILIPTDFSPGSISAFQFALEICKVVEGEILVVHVVDVPIIQETTFGVQPYLYAKEMAREAIANANRLFEKMKEGNPSDVEVTFKPVQEDLLAILPELISKNQIDLIVMSNHDGSELEEFIFGTTVEKITRNSTVPVLAIPKYSVFDSIQNIVFPNTLELDQDELVENVKGLQTLFNAKLHLLLVNTPTHFMNDAQCMAMLRQFAEHYQLKNYTLNYRNHDDEKSGILSFAAEIDANLIAMSTHGRKGLAHFFKGSIAESVLGRVDYPIWIKKM